MSARYTPRTLALIEELELRGFEYSIEWAPWNDTKERCYHAVVDYPFKPRPVSLAEYGYHRGMGTILDALIMALREWRKCNPDMTDVPDFWETYA